MQVRNPGIKLNEYRYTSGNPDKPRLSYKITLNRQPAAGSYNKIKSRGFYCYRYPNKGQTSSFFLNAQNKNSNSPVVTKNNLPTIFMTDTVPTFL
jgi:hypothetical protein